MITSLAGGGGHYLRFMSTGAAESADGYTAEVAKNPGPTGWTPGRLVAPSAGPTEIRLIDIDERVATLANVPLETVLLGGRGRKNLGRVVAIKAAYDLTGAPSDAIAEHYQFATSGAMHAMLRRCDDLTSDTCFVDLHSKLLQAFA